MDMQMPGMDGLTATRLIREMERKTGAPPTPLVMLTANALPEHIKASLEAGADRHMSKPVTAGVLLATVAELLDAAAENAPPLKAPAHAGMAPCKAETL